MSDTLLGVLIGAAISSFFSVVFERHRFKRDLQLRAAKDMLDCIKEIEIFLCKLPYSFDFLLSEIDLYHNYINENKVLRDIGVLPLSLEIIRDRINSFYNDFLDKRRLLLNNFHTIYITYEVNEVILNEFKIFYQTIGDTYKELSKVEEKIVMCFLDIRSNILNKEFINEDLIDKYNSLNNMFKKYIADLLGYFEDFKTDLQNYYLSGYFQYEVPKREPEDKEKYPVLTIDNKKQKRIKIIKKLVVTVLCIVICIAGAYYIVDFKNAIDEQKVIISDNENKIKLLEEQIETYQEIEHKELAEKVIVETYNQLTGAGSIKDEEPIGNIIENVEIIKNSYNW